MTMEPVASQPGDHHLLERVTGWIAVGGGLLALGVAVLVTVSVLSRWLAGQPIEGDFEFVKMATAIAVFAYLPYTEARRGNMMVDTFTTWLPAGVTRAMDAFWSLVYAAFMGVIAYCLVHGTMDTIRSHETTMQLQLPLWPAIAIATVLCIGLAVTALMSAIRHARGGR
jgi:TRAP-type C4-dicarboxylate transport system permease small subunit